MRIGAFPRLLGRFRLFDDKAHPQHRRRRQAELALELRNGCVFGLRQRDRDVPATTVAAIRCSCHQAAIGRAHRSAHSFSSAGKGSLTGHGGGFKRQPAAGKLTHCSGGFRRRNCSCGFRPFGTRPAISAAPRARVARRPLHYRMRNRHDNPRASPRRDHPRAADRDAHASPATSSQEAGARTTRRPCSGVERAASANADANSRIAAASHRAAHARPPHDPDRNGSHAARDANKHHSRTASKRSRDHHESRLSVAVHFARSLAWGHATFAVARCDTAPRWLSTVHSLAARLER